MLEKDYGETEIRHKKKLFVSFSAGKTSAYMAKRLKEDYQDQYEMVFGFANTGEEDEKTLIFADRCDREFGLDLVYLEAVVNGKQIGTTHRIVTFETCSRKGEPFEAVIQKYGIPNHAYPHCTRELKLAPMTSYLNSIGWTTGTYVSAVGIRVDEPKRLRKKAAEFGIVYPMAHWFPTTKAEVNDFWGDQPFQLGLEEHQGNCRWCWKKSLRKHIMLIKENPEAYIFPARMEGDYGLAGHNVDGTKRVFFRGNTSTQALIQIANNANVIPVANDSDEDAGCSESCEAYL